MLVEPESEVIINESDSCGKILDIEATQEVDWHDFTLNEKHECWKTVVFFLLLRGLGEIVSSSVNLL